MTNDILVALAGNPNCGKSTLFNELTGGRQHVSNYPGITVEKKEGFLHAGSVKLRVVDLPGTYSLSAYSMEELVARDFIVEEKPHVIVNIVDATNLERHLYLTVQILELGSPLILVLNMMDLAEQRGLVIDADKLSQRLGVPVVPMVARVGRGKNNLIAKILEHAYNPGNTVSLNISYGPDIDHYIHEMEELIKTNAFMMDKYPPRWIALKYLEEDQQVTKKGLELNKEIAYRLEGIASRVADHLEKTLDTYPEAVIADYRYGFIHALLKDEVVKVISTTPHREITDHIDKIVTNRFFGPLIMIAVLYLVYKVTFSYSEVPTEWLERGFGLMADVAKEKIPAGPFQSLIVNGIIAGVGSIVGFGPLIALMFFFIAILEDTGYLARVAYMCDRIFRFFGLHGNSVMAFIIGGGIAGGCAVPGVMATRTLRSSKERIATILAIPFMNCGAKVPVYAMIIATFFENHKPLVLFILTLGSWFIALTMARLMRSSILPGSPTPFLLELPSYRLPTLKGLLIHTWERTWQYLRKAGTVILAISVLVWALMSFPKPSEDALRNVSPEERGRVELEYSFAGRIGKGLTAITQFCGFDWKINVALVGGFTAKEVILSTLGMAYSLTDNSEQERSLGEMLKGDHFWTPLRAWAFMIFVMTYAPCIVSLVCIAKEAGGIRWSIFALVFNSLVAFCLATIIYRVGLLLGYN